MTTDIVQRDREGINASDSSEGISGWRMEVSTCGPDAARALEGLISALDGERSREAMDALSELGAHAAPAIDALCHQLRRHTDEATRAHAARTLSRIGAPARRAVPVLFECVGDASRLVRSAVSDAIRVLGSD